jgi:hypothetical protein
MHSRDLAHQYPEPAFLDFYFRLRPEARNAVLTSGSVESLIRWFSERLLTVRDIPPADCNLVRNSKFVNESCPGLGVQEITFHMYESHVATREKRELLLPDEIASPSIVVVSPAIIQDGVAALVSTQIPAEEIRELHFLGGNLRADCMMMLRANAWKPLPSPVDRNDVLLVPGPNFLVQVLPKSNPSPEEMIDPEAFSRDKSPRGVYIVRHLRAPETL